MAERKYNEEEVAEIFALATTAGTTNLPAASRADEGMTLGELQAVGEEVGLAPERVAQAAASLTTRAEVIPARVFLGAPLTAGRIIDLPRAPTDREWQFIIAELRQTFDAKGTVSSYAGVREWSNGNLHAVLEETESGPRIRISTLKGIAREIAGGALIMGGVAAFMTIAMLSKGRVGLELMLPGLFAMGSAAALISTRLSLPKWASLRGRQMEHIGRRARELLSGPAPEVEGEDGQERPALTEPAPSGSTS